MLRDARRPAAPPGGQSRGAFLMEVHEALLSEDTGVSRVTVGSSDRSHWGVQAQLHWQHWHWQHTGTQQLAWEPLRAAAPLRTPCRSCSPP